MSGWRMFVAMFATVTVAGSLAAGPAAAEFTPASRVIEVTVYRQAALVTREARVALPPGDHRVILTGLPDIADPSSVRVSGSGSAGIQIGGLEVRQDFGQPNLSP